MGTDSKCVKYDLSELELYKKKKLKLHFLRSLDVQEQGRPVVVHTLEGDVTIVAGEDRYIMIGPHEDVYPISKAQFESKYQVVEGADMEAVRATSQLYGVDITRIKACRVVKDSYVYACRVDKEFSVYTKHCDSVLSGKAGDYYAVTYEDTDNVYIIQQDIMKETYEKVI